MSAQGPDYDPYDIGQVWDDVNEFATNWRVDPGTLRRALNLCAAGMRLPLGKESAGQRRKALERIASSGRAFASALTDAGNDTLFYLLCGLAPRSVRTDIMLNPSRHCRKLVDQVQELAELADQQVAVLKVTKKPIRTAPTYHERMLVTIFTELWRETHGTFANVTDRKGGTQPDRRAANEGGRFVIAIAQKYFEMPLSDQRLRTVLASIAKATAET